MSFRIFIGGLSRDITESELRDRFEEFGTVEQATIILDKASGLSRGFGFINFADSSGMHSAIDKLHGRDFAGRTISVRLANKEDPALLRRDGGGGFRPRDRFERPRDSGYRRDSRDYRDRDPYERSDRYSSYDRRDYRDDPEYYGRDSRDSRDMRYRDTPREYERDVPREYMRREYPVSIPVGRNELVSGGYVRDEYRAGDMDYRRQERLHDCPVGSASHRDR